MDSGFACFPTEAYREGWQVMAARCDASKFMQSIDAMIRALCPGALSLHVCRIDSPKAQPHRSIYDADRSIFRTTKAKQFIREARCGEFDYTPSKNALTMEQYPSLAFQRVGLPNEMMNELWKEIPQLWALVTDCGNGVHHISTIYRGPAKWEVVEREGMNVAKFATDAAFSEALQRIQACEGCDLEAWSNFVQKMWDGCVLNAANVPENCGVTH